VGAWGHGPFDNDDALDFLGDLDAGRRGTFRWLPGRRMPRGLASALAAVTDADGYLDAGVVSTGVAAAALVAAAAGGPRPDTDVVAAWLDAHPFVPDDGLRAGSRAELDRAFEPADNEWYDLWADAGAVDDVRAALAPYRAALGS
jgi:hypothetical protein